MSELGKVLFDIAVTAARETRAEVMATNPRITLTRSQFTAAADVSKQHPQIDAGELNQLLAIRQPSRPRHNPHD